MKRKKIKSNQALALFLCGLLLLCSIGLVLARGGKPGDEYACNDLTLTQFQGQYNLMSGITYDEKKYVLSVADEGGFDVNTPGTYQVAYQLTPIAQTAAPLPLPEPSGGSNAPAASGGSVVPTKPDTDTPTVKPEPAKPDTDTPAVKPEPAKPDTDTPTDKPKPVKPNTDTPAVKPEPAKPDTDTPAVKPEPAKPDQGASSSKPDSGKQPDQDTSDTKPESVKPGPAKSDTNPDINTKSDANTKSDQKIPAAKSLSFRSGSEPLFTSQNLVTGNFSCGLGSGSPTLILASNDQDTADQDTAKGSDTSADSQPSGGQSGTGAADSADSQPSGDQSGSSSHTPADSQHTNDQIDSGSHKPAGGQHTDDQSGSGSHKPADSQHTGDQSDSSSGSSHANTPSNGPSGSQDQSGSGSADGQGTGSGSSAADHTTGSQSGSGSSAGTGPAAGDHEAPLMPIDFTRTVIVEPAVTYDNLRLDVHSAKASLYEGITYDPQQFAVNVQKDQNGQEEDSHFSIDRIDEYEVTYDLIRLSDNQKMSEFQRYVWVTAPGVTFDAPPLSVDPSKKIDLFQNITYDDTKYEISLVDPNEFDPAEKGIQRIRYRLTPKPGTQSQSDQKPASSNASEEQSGEQTPATQPDSAPATQPDSAPAIQPESAPTTQTDSASAASSDSAPAGVQSAAVGKFGSDSLLMGDTNASKDPASTSSDSDNPAVEDSDGSKISDSKPSGSSADHTYVLTAAIFGRDVTSGSQPFIKWDAKPLVITQGAVNSVNLLSGVTAVNEKGEPVQVVVQDRSQIDMAISAAEAGAQQPPVDSASSTASGASSGTNSDAVKDAARKADDSGPLILPPRSNNLLSASDQGKTSESNSTLPTDASGAGASKASRSTGTADASKDGAGTDGTTSNGTNAGNADASSGAPSNDAPSNDTASGAASNQTPSHDILVGEDATLTPEMVAALQPGVSYNFIMLAKDPVTGMESRQTRSATVRMTGPGHAQVQFSTDNGASWSNANPSVTEKGTIPKALSYIKTECSAGGGFVPSKSQPVIARITVSGNYNGSASTPYTFDVTDQTALSNFKMANPWLTVRLSTPKPDSENTYDQAAYRLLISTSKGIQFPYVSDSSQYAAFEMQDLRLDSSDSTSECYIQAMGSKLTMGTGVHLVSSGDMAYRVVGGQYGSNPGQLNTDVTVYGSKKTGTSETYYRNVCGGNYNSNTTGSTHVTLDGATISDKTGAAPQNVWGGGAGLYADQSGDSTITVKASGSDKGKIKILYGGCAGTQQGNTSVIIDDGSIGTVYGGSVGVQAGNSTITVNGGSITTALYGAGTGYIGSMTNQCHIQITVNGGSIKVFYAGTMNKQVAYGTADVYVNGGSIDSLLSSSDLSPTLVVNFHIKGDQNGVTGAHIIQMTAPSGLDQTKIGVVNVDVSGELKVQTFEWFTSLTLKENAKVTVNNSIQNTKTSFGTMSGKVIFEKNSTLTLFSHKKSAWSSFSPNQIGSFQTNGSGAVLELYRDKFTDKGTAIVYTKNESDMVTLKQNPLTLRFIGPDAGTADTGTPVLFYDWSGDQAGTGNKALAAHPEWYKGDFPRELGVNGNPDNGVISVGGGDVGLQSKTHGVPDLYYNSVTYYGTIAAADKAIKADGNDYMVSIRKEGYSLTPADGAAIAGANVSSGSVITYTSQYEATKNDPLKSPDEVGKTVKRTVLIGPDIPSGHEAVISFPSDTNISDITLQYSAKGSIFANGHTLNINSGVDVQSQTQYFPVLYGGAEKTVVASTNLQINGGKFSGIYGGGKEAAADVTGKANLKISGGTLTGPLYGGGKAGNVGSVGLNITGGNLEGTKNLQYAGGTEIDGTQNLVIGGGETGDVKNKCDVEISGGTANGPTTVAGCDQGMVGQVDMTIMKTGIETTIKLPLANVYGGGLRGGTVGDSATLVLISGSDYGTISGGGNPGYSWPAGTHAFDSVKGKKMIYIDGAAFEVYNILNFDAVLLNTQTSGTIMTVKGNMDYDPAFPGPAHLPGSTASADGYLRLGQRSVINFSKADKADSYNPTLRVKGLLVESEGAHLHIYKDKSGTHPLAVEGPYLKSTADNTYHKINLGVIEEGSGGGDGGGAPGDVLLKFPNQNADPQYYIADSSSMEIAANADKTQIQYGKRDYPQGTMTGVALTDGSGIDVVGSTAGDPSSGGGKVTKTLSVLFHSNHKEGAYSNDPVTAAYVSTDAVTDKTWAASDNDSPPAGGTKITVSKEKSEPDDPHFWTGETTISIPQPAAPNEYAAYYVHVKTQNHATATIACDVQPILPSSGNTEDETASSGDGSYTFTRSFLDYVMPTTDPTIPYTASGLYQWGWSVGDTSGPDPSAIRGAVKNPMENTTGSTASGGLTVGSFGGNLWQVQPITFTVPAAQLGLKPGSDPATALKDKVVYIFLKDKMGNTSELRIPMSQSCINFTFPTRVGIIALRNPKSATSQVLAPNCYVINNDTNSAGPGIKVEITEAKIPKGPSPLKFVNAVAPGPWASDEITLLLKSVPGSSDFAARSIMDIHDSPTQTLTLGTMWPKNATDTNGQPRPSCVNFTFGAQFDPQINLTDDWSRFSLTYRFSILPPKELPSGLSPGPVSSPGPSKAP